MNYLVIQTTYEQLQIGLFQNQGCLDSICSDKKESSKYSVTYIDTLLTRNKLLLRDFSFIAVNQGPAPFTSLRVVIATVNGLSFASNIPLVGVDGLQAFMNEHTNTDWPYTVSFINAYNNDVYYALQIPNFLSGQSLNIGYKNIHELLKELKIMFSVFGDKKIRFIGNGTQLFENDIKNVFQNNAYIPTDLPLYPSLQQISYTGLNQWQKKENVSNHVLPLYLKTLQYKKSIEL